MMKKQLKNEIRSHQKNAKSEPVEAESKQFHEISWLSKAWQFLLPGQKAKAKHHEQRTNGNIRSLGIGAIDKAPWGTHICQFYQTKEDLIDILVPYLKAGLENNEFCMWVTSEPLTAEEAKEALKKAVKNLGDYLHNGQIEILNYTECYVTSGKFDPDKVLRFGGEKMNLALQRGYDGLRGAGNIFWLDQKEWRDFVDYEASVDGVIGEHRTLAICSYALHKCGASEILDVVSNHQYCLIKQNGLWRLTRSAGRERAEEEIKNLTRFPSEDSNPVLRIARGGQILYANEAGLSLLAPWNTGVGGFMPEEWITPISESLDSERAIEKVCTLKDQTFSFRITPVMNTGYVNIYGRDITEQKRTAENLKHALSDLNQIFNASVPIWVIGKDYTMIRVNETFCTSFGLKREDVQGKKCYEIWQGPFCDTPKCPLKQIISGMEHSEHEVVDKELSDGRKVSCIITAIPYRGINGELLGIVENFTDITERKKTEEELEKYRFHLEEIVKERTAQLLQEITERKQSEEALRKSEERWRKYFELGLIGIAVTSPEKKWIEVNDYLCQILGYSRQELMKMTWTELTCPENLESDLAKFNRMVIGEVDGVKTETRFVRKDGKIIDASISTRCLRNQDGAIEYFVVLIRDITDRKQAENALKKSEENYKTLVENSRDMIFTVDLKGNFLFTNKAFETVLGYTPEELSRLNGFELVHPEDLETVKERFNELIKGKVQNDIEYRYKTKRGHYINILNNPVPLFDPQGKVFAALGMARDITERKGMEEALRQSEAKYRNLMENASDAIVIADEEGNVLQVNKKAETLLGYKREELINMNITQIHPKEDLERNLRAFNEMRRKGGEGVLTNGSVLRKDGQTVPVDMTGSVITYGNKQVMQGIFRDTTERKKKEEELIKVQKMKAIGLLAGGIAHDFNNLLTAIIGNLSLIEVYAKSGEEDIFEVLEETKKAAQQTRHLTQQLLTFSKGGEPVKKPASISESLKETIGFALSGSKAKCELSLQDDLWIAEIDKGQTTQVISNLIINADQAMPQGGTIGIHAENVMVRPEDGLPLAEGKYIKISIKDQGIGITKEFLSKIFDPYFTTKQKGSGLGLSIAYSIIQKHKGHITVESKIGSGSVFSIYLPALDKEAFSVQKIEEKRPFPGKGKVLFMDDQKNIRNMIGKMLTHLGYEVEFASDGSEAIEMYIEAKEEGQPFDVVILDLTVPGGMGGQEAIQKLTEIDPEVKAIVSSGYANDPIIADYKKYGFKDMVAKPYEIQELSETLYKVVTGVKETRLRI